MFSTLGRGNQCSGIDAAGHSPHVRGRRYSTAVRALAQKGPPVFRSWDREEIGGPDSSIGR
jgi:hypothetical protein